MAVLKTVSLFLFLSKVFFQANCKLIDMSFPYKNNSVTFPGITPFSISLVQRGPYLGLSHDIHLNENTGTHMDAPVHFFKGKTSVDKIPPEDLMAEAIVVNITEQASRNRDYELTVDDLKNWEKKHGVIPNGSVVFILTGRGKYWEDFEKYMGRKENGKGSFHWPGFAKATAQWLVDDRKIKGVGTDARTYDVGPSTTFPAHRIFLGNNVYCLERVANIDKLPVKGATVYVMPMKIKGGTGGPTRVIAETDPTGQGSNSSILATSRLIDMSFPFENNMVTWPGLLSFQICQSVPKPYTEKALYLLFDIKFNEHTGTHVDAPAHFAKGKRTVDEIELENLIAKAVVVDITEQTSKDRDYALTVDDLKNWEKKHGMIPDGSVVFILTGLGKHWGNYEKYMGKKENSKDSFHWPGFAKATAQWLVDNRTIKGVGTDARSYDVGPSTDFPAHQIFLGKDIYCLESVANIDKLPVKGATVYVMPMKVKGGTGGPTRVIAQTELSGRSSHQKSSILVIFLSILLSLMVLNYK